MSATVVFSPAKINLFLAVTGRRPDGFHDLVSVAAPLTWGDSLRIEATEKDNDFSLTCDDPAVPRDKTNLVLKAAWAFRAATAWKSGARFHLDKRIPMGAGLGGGSSNAVAALRGLNMLAGEPLSPSRLAELAIGLGSDCALFLPGRPVAMRGRGERVAPLPFSSAARLSGRRVLIFKPGFSIGTPWAYGQLAAQASAGGGEAYWPAAAAEARLAAWCEDATAPADALLFNHLERVAFRKFPALPALLAQLQAKFGLAPRMSGSGSACFALLPENAPVDAIMTAISSACGPATFAVETHLA